MAIVAAPQLSRLGPQAPKHLTPRISSPPAPVTFLVQPGSVVQAPPAMCPASSRCLAQQSANQTARTPTKHHAMLCPIAKTANQTLAGHSTCAPAPLLGRRRALLYARLNVALPAPSAARMHARPPGNDRCPCSVRMFQHLIGFSASGPSGSIHLRRRSSGWLTCPFRARKDGSSQSQQAGVKPFEGPAHRGSSFIKAASFIYEHVTGYMLPSCK